MFIFIYIKSLNHFAIPLKLTQHCEPTILKKEKELEAMETYRAEDSYLQLQSQSMVNLIYELE